MLRGMAKSHPKKKHIASLCFANRDFNQMTPRGFEKRFRRHGFGPIRRIGRHRLRLVTDNVSPNPTD